MCACVGVHVWVCMCGCACVGVPLPQGGYLLCPPCQKMVTLVTSVSTGHSGMLSRPMLISASPCWMNPSPHSESSKKHMMNCGRGSRTACASSVIRSPSQGTQTMSTVCSQSIEYVYHVRTHDDPHNVCTHCVDGHAHHVISSCDHCVDRHAHHHVIIVMMDMLVM